MSRPLSQTPIRDADGAATSAIPHGSLKDFYGGIDTRIGVTSLDFYEQMRKEHCEFKGCEYEFTSSNYTITTSPKQEWLLVTEGQNDSRVSVQISESKSVRRRTPAHWWNHLKPASSSEFLFSEDNDPKVRSQKVLSYLSNKLGLLMEEVIGIMLFTGPMFTVYNSVLSKFPPDIADNFVPINFTTTIHAIISAIQKLSLRTPVQSVVYRGTGGRGFLPDCFWQAQEGLNVYGFTEFGIMSMTSSKDVAVEYSGVLLARPHAAILAFAAGAIDRGANVQEISQFPLEVEFTFPPLSYIQPEFVDGAHKIEYIQHHEAPGVDVPVIHVRVNANIRPLTLDELNSARKTNHIALFRSQNRDTVAEIRRMFNVRRDEISRRFSSKMIASELLEELKIAQHCTTVQDPVRTAFDGFVSVIYQQCETILKDHEQKNETVFIDKIEHSRLLTEVLSVRKWAVAKVHWYVEDDHLEFNDVLHYPLLKSYQEYVSFCRRQIQKHPCGAERNARALFLCRMLGLVAASYLECNISLSSNGQPVIEAVENGASCRDVELLLDAGFNVESTNPAGSSLLSIAARYGYVQLCELLIRKKADVNFVNTFDHVRTPLMFAAANDHLDCLQLLLKHGARPSSVALQHAKEHGNVECVNALTAAGACQPSVSNARLRRLTVLGLPQMFSVHSHSTGTTAHSTSDPAPIRTLSRSSSTRIQAVSTHIVPADAVHKGWLFMKGRFQWKRRFVVLDTVKKEMFCYADEVDAHSHTAPRRSWSLIGYAASEDNDNTTAFKISGVGLRKYFFRAEGLQTRSEWITIMRKSLQQDQQTTSAAAASASPATHMSGWLNKHGGSFLKTWNRRFFVLNEETATMSYYVAAEDYSRNMAPKCSLQLALYTTVAADSVHNSNAFKLSGAGCKTYHLQANSPIEQQEWICRLGRVLRSQKLYHANVSSLLIDDEEREVERFFGDAGQNPGEKVGLEHFELKTVIGRGAFGKVVLVQKKSDKKIYAMKCLSKAKLLSANQVGRVLSENRILRRIDHPYIVSMKYAFQAEAKLYLVLEFVNGGDLYWNLRAVKCFSSHQVCLYAAELVLALGHLHSLDIVHRNLKPENVLICCDGHLKLTDFGLIKENISSEVNTGSICGTPQYLAPEMLCGDEMTPTRYGKDVDWWALGVVMFEMLMGQPPFFHVNTAQMYSMILHMTVQEALDNSPQSIDVPAEFRAILHALLAKKPSDRLGFGPDDAQSVKMHPFFAPIDWQKLERREVASPYQPKVKDGTDSSIFDARLTSQAVAESQEEGSKLSESNQDRFKGFTYAAYSLGRM